MQIDNTTLIRGATVLLSVSDRCKSFPETVFTPGTVWRSINIAGGRRTSLVRISGGSEVRMI